MAQHMLTTVDNPHDPYTSFTEWFNWDTQHQYHTLSLLARIVRSSDDLSAADEALAIEDAMQEIVAENVSGMHRLVTASTQQPNT